ncbi:hypothetical protein ABFA07_020074 [Porites harrisoni]
MKRQAFLGRHFQFCSMKFMLFFFLSSLFIQDVLPASIKSCELRASCSSECQDSTQKTVTVNPRSNATVGCSIMNKGSTQDLTWEQVRRKIHGSNNVYDLVVQQQENPHCSCTQITLARPVLRVFKPSSPVWFKEKIQLNCTFKGWPRPTVVWINPHGNKIKSGSDGFEIYEEIIGDDTLSSVLKNPHMQEKQYGEYWCTAENSIDGWSSKLSKVTELIYECPWPINPKVSSSKVTADTSSNKSFKCMIHVDPDYCADVLELQWRFNDSSAPIKSGKKYKIQEKNTNSKCKKEFTLTINDVTVEDKGNYSCQSICYEETTFAVFELKVKDAAETSMNAV